MLGETSCKNAYGIRALCTVLLLGATACDAAQKSDSTCAVPAAAPMRRLTANEYRNTVESMFSFDSLTLGLSFVVETERNAFDNNEATQTLSRSHVQKLQQNAERIAAHVLETPESLDRIAPDCDLGEKTCLTETIQAVGLLAFRRPLSTEEVEEVESLIDDLRISSGAERGAAVVEALLQSPQFLFRIEEGALVEGEACRKRLTGYELASRLSFMFRQRAPDKALLDRAARGELDSPEGVEQVARELMSEELQSGRSHFLNQWLRIDELLERAARGDMLASSAARELELLSSSALSDDGSLVELLSWDHAYVDEALAELYGVSAPSSGFERVSLGIDSQRGGLMGTAGILMLDSVGEHTSIVQRGREVLSALLCQPPRLPPPGFADALPQPEEGANPYDYIFERMEHEVCGGCHRSMDGIGLGLEGFGPRGGQRTVVMSGENQYPIPSAGSFTDATGAVHDFAGARELGELLVEDARFSECFSRTYLRWLLGRDLLPDDEPAIASFVEAFELHEHRFPDLVLSIVTSDYFRYRPVEQQ